MTSAVVAREVDAPNACYHFVVADESEPPTVERVRTVVAEYEELPLRNEQRPPVVTRRYVMHRVATRVTDQIDPLPAEIVNGKVRRVGVLRICLRKGMAIDHHDSTGHR